MKNSDDGLDWGAGGTLHHIKRGKVITEASTSTNKITVEDAALFMKNVEDVADEFGVRKLQQLRRLGFINYKDIEINKGYENATPSRFYFLIEEVRKLLKEKNITDSSEISEILYNWVKVEV